MRMPLKLGVLRTPGFRPLFLGQLTSVFGDRIVAVALPFAVFEIGGSSSEVGLVLACAVFPMVASVLVGGVVADRVSRRAVMVGADLLRVVTQAMMAALLIAGDAEVWMLAMLAGATSVATGFFNPASTGLLPEVVPPEQLQPANALGAGAISAGKVLGPMVAGLLVATAGAGWAIAIDAATFVISAACLLMLRVPQRPAAPAGSFFSELRGGWVAFRSRRWVWSLVAYLTFANMLWGAWSVLGPLVSVRHLGGVSAWGFIVAAVGVGSLLGSVLATQIEPRLPLVFFAATEAVFAVPLALLAVGAPTAVLACGGLVSGAGMMLGSSVWETTLQRHVPADALSRVTSYVWFGAFGLNSLGLGLWAPVASMLGISVTLWLAFGLYAVAILVLVAVPETRRLGAYPAPGVSQRTAAQGSLP